MDKNSEMNTDNIFDTSSKAIFCASATTLAKSGTSFVLSPSYTTTMKLKSKRIDETWATEVNSPPKGTCTSGNKGVGAGAATGETGSSVEVM